MNLLLVGFGGFLGSIARYYIGTLLQRKIIGTFIVNVTGAALLAYITHFYYIGQISISLWLFVGSGFSGAYTTFSTFGYETLQLFLESKYKQATFYMIGSLMISIVTVWFVFYMLNR